MSSTSGPRRLSRRTEVVLMTVGALAVLGLITFGALRVLQVLLAGDEPPIRVKNGGSMLTELATSEEVEWTLQSGNEWSHNGGVSAVPEYWVIVKTAAGKTCEGEIPNPVSRVRVIANNNEKLSFRHVSSRARMKPDRSHFRPDPKTLNNLGGPGQWIRRIELRGDSDEGSPKWQCTFNAKEELVEMLLCPEDPRNVPCP